LSNRDALQEILVPFFASRTKAEVLQLAQENDLLCAPINDYELLLRHPQVEANHLVHDWSHPQLGRFQGIRSPIRSSEREARISPPPMLGEHGPRILSEELGLDASEIARLTADGTIGVNQPGSP
jgi:crotonobetainyl-CoA:carnitine CoA-transferase CaiB-like acyl-CoA transferase